jgi:hypothetical protein
LAFEVVFARIFVITFAYFHKAEESILLVPKLTPPGDLMQQGAPERVLEDILRWGVNYFWPVGKFNCFVSNYIKGDTVEGSFGAHAGGTVPAINIVGPAVQNVTDGGVVDNLFEVDFATVRQFSLVGFTE